MLPIGDDDSARRTTPVVTYALILINFLFFFVELSAGDAFIEKWSLVPRRLLADPTGQFITIFTAMFMHAGWLHILGNMLYLWIFGDNVEDRLGHTKYLIFYLLCGVAATFAQVLVDPRSNVPNLGASGAIAGVLGIVIGFWAVLQFISGFGAIASTEQTGGGGVAYMAHVGGFIAGLVLAVLMGGTRNEPRLRAY
jgi:membrane associated rhomboid family serine protease